MLNMILLTINMVLCVLGIYFLVKEITSALLKNHVMTKVIVEIAAESSDAEYAIRSAADANPGSEIIVIDRSGSEEISSMLNMLSCDNERIHIKTAPTK